TEEIRRIVDVATEHAGAPVFSPDGKRLAWSRTDATIQLADVATPLAAGAIGSNPQRSFRGPLVLSHCWPFFDPNQLGIQCWNSRREAELSERQEAISVALWSAVVRRLATFRHPKDVRCHRRCWKRVARRRG